MATHIIVSASRSTDPAPLSMTGTLAAIADALGTTTDAVAATSVALVGEWEGTREHSRAIDVSGAENGDVYALAYGLKVRLGQDAVMILTTDEHAAEFWQAHGGTRCDVYPVSGAGNSSVQYEGDAVVHLPNRTRWTTVDADGGAYVAAFIAD